MSDMSQVQAGGQHKLRPGLLKLWVAGPNGVLKCNFGVAKQIGLTSQI